MPSSLKRFFASPLRSQKKKAPDSCSSIPSHVDKSQNDEDSLRGTVESHSRDDEEDVPLHYNNNADDDDDDDDYQTTMMSSAKPLRQTEIPPINICPESVEAKINDRCADDFRKTVLESLARNEKSPTKIDIPTTDMPCIIATRHIGSEDDEDENDNDGATEELLDFDDDHRSTISGLTEATGLGCPSPLHGNHYNSSVPPSPSNNSTVNKKMEDFLKNETEAIRQILSTVESGDDESTIVEESVKGANEAEKMAREMELEMEKLVQGGISGEEGSAATETTIDHEASGIPSVAVGRTGEVEPSPQPPTTPIISPESNEFLADIRSVIHPLSDGSIEPSRDRGEDKSCASLGSYSTRKSSSSYRRDLFRKRSGLYKLKQNEKAKRLKRKKRRRKRIRKTLMILMMSFLLTCAGFTVHWRVHHPNQPFLTTLQETMEYAHSSAKDQFQHKILPAVDHTRVRLVTGIGSTVSLAVTNANIYAPLARNRASEGIRSTTEIVHHHLDYYFWNEETKLRFKGFPETALQSTKMYLKDKFEYTFTDRAAREQKLLEEQRHKELLEAAAAAAAREAAEQKQQLWTQTMVAGACAFAGSVATNLLWSALG